MLRGDLGHLLIDRDRVLIRRPELPAGQPNRDAVVVVTESTRMMQAVFEMTPAEQVECKASQSLPVGWPIPIVRAAQPVFAAQVPGEPMGVSPQTEA